MDCDRLSGLSDDLILQILSFVGIEDAIKTSVLSPRWRYLWTCIPRLSFSSQDFSTVDNFSNFVTHVLSRRNNQLQLSSFDLYFCGKHCHRPSALKIMNHAFSLNAKQLNIACLIENHESCGRVEFPLSLPGSKTLKHLTLKQPDLPFDQFVLVSSHEFSSLTTLQLHCVTLYDGFLSMCPNLKNLTLHCCKVTKSRDLTICHPRLSNLKLEQRDMSTRTVNVVTPELKNLTILRYNDTFRVSAPKLASLYFKGPCPFIFLADGFPCLEKALLAFRYLGDIHSAFAPAVIGMIQLFHNVKLLSLSMEIIQLLNSSVELFSHRPSPLANLESLRLLPKIFFLYKQKPTNIIMSAEVKNYLLSSSPKATLTELNDVSSHYDINEAVVARHEAGHAVVGTAVSKLLAGQPRVEKLSILPRSGGALGFTYTPTTEDRYLLFVDELRGRLVTLLGGRAAEEIIYSGRVSTGALDDIRRATDMAYKAIAEYGLNRAIGPISLATLSNGGMDDSGGSGFGKDQGHLVDLVQGEVKLMLQSALDVALSIMRANPTVLEGLGAYLEEKEKVEGEELQEWLKLVVAPEELAEFVNGTERFLPLHTAAPELKQLL